MVDLSNNPFSDKIGNPLIGKEIDWLKWNSQARNDSNPYIDSEGGIFEDKYDEFSDYMNQCQKDYQKDLLKLPIDLRQELENETRLLSERMQVEATGRR